MNKDERGTTNTLLNRHWCITFQSTGVVATSGDVHPDMLLVRQSAASILNMSQPEIKHYTSLEMSQLVLSEID